MITIRKEGIEIKCVSEPNPIMEGNETVYEVQSGAHQLKIYRGFIVWLSTPPAPTVSNGIQVYDLT